ncbi:uncharacterized protein LOC118749369 [Rhagoletis pomonella]|uniref:uncharacterized protein LOC118749369 n=1 Tax=Rhagoletis pomonella TaxID=28610 RepID=UPI00177EBAF9|nr:uncharacterized protein LOC118749369 [Rhagoletis pomonella]
MLYEPHLFYFDEMSFLDSVVVLRKTSSNMNNKNVEIAVEALETVDDHLNLTLTEDILPTQSPTPSPSTSTSTSLSVPSSSSSLVRRRRNRSSNSDAKFDQAIEAIVSSATTSDKDNVFTSFAKSIALQLEQLPLIEATETMSEIHNIVTRKVIGYLAASQHQSNGNSEHDILELAIADADISF